MGKCYTHVYTGNGKGKTTSCIGLMVRAVGFGMKVYFGQFMKDGNYCEIKLLQERFPEIAIEQFGNPGFIAKSGSSQKDIDSAREGIKKSKAAIDSGQYNMVVLDEINVALFMELIHLDDVLNIIDNKPENVELVLSGRYAHEKVIEKADLVSEINMVKHYFNDGVMARKGIEF